MKTSSRWTLIEGFNTWGEGFCSEAEAGRPSRDSSTPLSRNPALFSSVLGTTIHCVPFLAPPPTLPVQIEREVTDWRFIWPWKDFSRPSFLFSKSRTRRILIRALNSNILFCARMQSTMEQSPWLRLCLQSKVAQVRSSLPICDTPDFYKTVSFKSETGHFCMPSHQKVLIACVCVCV